MLRYTLSRLLYPPESQVLFLSSRGRVRRGANGAAVRAPARPTVTLAC